MTDTARTVAELKALFASNSAGDIDAQDLRDLVESLANPVAGGGFGAVSVPDDQMALFSAGGGTPQPIAPSTFTPLDLNADIDPQGWLQSGSSYVSTFWGQTYTPGQWLALPEGLYSLYMLAGWETTDATGFRETCFTFVDNRLAAGGFDDFLSAQGFINAISRGDAVALFEQQIASGMFRVRADEAPFPVAIRAAQSSAATLGVVVYCYLMRLTTVV